MRRTTLFAAAAALLFTAPAFAGELMTGGIPVGSNANFAMIANMAAGIGNVAQQKVTGVQKSGGAPGIGFGAPGFGAPGVGVPGVGVPGFAPPGFGFGGLAGPNGVSVANTAAGVGNVAQQKVKSVQLGGAPGLFGGNSGSITNLAAGIGNVAQQSVTTIQK